MKRPNITTGPFVIEEGFVRPQDMAEQLLDPHNEKWVAVGYEDADGYAASVAYCHPDLATKIAALATLCWRTKVKPHGKPTASKSPRAVHENPRTDQPASQ